MISWELPAFQTEFWLKGSRNILFVLTTMRIGISLNTWNKQLADEINHSNSENYQLKR